MVTIRQFSRGVGRVVRAAERDAQRAQRQRLLNERAEARQAHLDASADAAEAYQDLVDHLTGCHRVDFDRRDWATVATAAVPIAPQFQGAREQRAMALLSGYHPNWFSRTFGMARRERNRLSAGVEKAKRDDAQTHLRECEDVERRREEIAFAQSVIARKSAALVSAFQNHSQISEAAIEAVSILAIDGRVITTVDSFELDDMPTDSITLLQSGKASFKSIPAGRRLEMHRDNICSSSIRVAAELLRALPLDAVEVIMLTDLLDRSTGHIDAQPVLYSRITAQALAQVNLRRAEATPLAELLGAHFEWSRRDGFRPINLDVYDLPSEILGG